MGVRIHSLAKRLGMSSKQLMAYLKTQGHPVKSHMSTIDESVAQILLDRLKPKASPPKKEPEKKAEMQAPDRAKAASAGKRPEANGARRVDSRPPAEPAAEKRAAEPGRQGTPGQPAAAAESEKGRRVKRFFPTDEYSSQAGSRFGGQRRKGGPPRRTTDLRTGGRAGVPATKAPEKVEVSLPVTLKDLSSSLGLKAQALMKILLRLGKVVTINQYLDEELVLELCMELGTEVAFKKKEDELAEALKDLETYESPANALVSRAPVVTFLGHVDHGKTSLLDKIRKTQVTQKEHGGITQHLGAYRVDKDNAHVTFIDTPGHKAFTEMRARGANVTDVAVLVVAADDGVMPQTEEAINHARAAEVPIVVALNKVDKPNANTMRCKEQLSRLGLQPVEWGGKTEFVEVSAMTGQGIDSLLETLSLESEILELKANPDRAAIGVVLEAEATTHRGVMATVLVQDGTLKLGDYVLAGASHGRVRSMLVNGTVPVREAGPSIPVTVVGLSAVPEAGEKFYVFDNEKQARHLAEERERRRREMDQAERYAVKKASLEDLFARMGASGGVTELKLILKADVRGSIEALRTSLEGLSTDEVKVLILHTGVGAISQEDVHLASASDAVILGFHVVADDRARTLAEEKGVEIRHYKVIYEAVDDIRKAMEARLAPEEVEEVHGRAEIRQVFRASKIGNIAGCMVTSGFIQRNDRIRLIRDGRVIFTGVLNTLKRFKDDVREVKEGFECGMKIQGYEDIKEGDVIEGFVVVQKARTL